MDQRDGRYMRLILLMPSPFRNAQHFTHSESSTRYFYKVYKVMRMRNGGSLRTELETGHADGMLRSGVGAIQYSC